MRCLGFSVGTIRKICVWFGLGSVFSKVERGQEDWSFTKKRGDGEMGHGNIPGHWHFKTRRCLVVPTNSLCCFSTSLRSLTVELIYHPQECLQEGCESVYIWVDIRKRSRFVTRAMLYKRRHWAWTQEPRGDSDT